jgi:4-hydroxy-4-methyl-2-oxoglutarate aldolase
MVSVSLPPSGLLALGIATLHEANRRRNLINGVRLLLGAPFAGPAVTVAIPAGDNLGIHLAIETAQPGSVVCVASAGRGLYGVIGDLLIEAARARGIAGLVIEDGIRDRDTLSPPPSVAALGINARGTVKRRLRQAVGSDVSVGNVLISSGDWIVCDEDGVIVLPDSTAAGVVERAIARSRSEVTSRADLAAGVTSPKLFGLPDQAPASLRE